MNILFSRVCKTAKRYDKTIFFCQLDFLSKNFGAKKDAKITQNKIKISCRNICRRNVFKSGVTEKFCVFQNITVIFSSQMYQFGRLHPNFLFRNGTNFLDPITILSLLPKPLIFPFAFLYSSNLSFTRLKKLLHSELKIVFNN